MDSRSKQLRRLLLGEPWLPAGRPRVLATIGIAAAFALAFIPLHHLIGTHTVALAAIPLSIIAWQWGSRGGLIAGILAPFGNAALLLAVGKDPWAILAGTSGGVIGSLVLLSLGVSVGWMSEMQRSARRELVARLSAEAKLQGSESQVRLQAAALEAAGNAIVITDPSGTIEWVNPAFTSLTGYRLDEVVGGNPRILKSGEQDPAFYGDLWRTVLSGSVWHGELVNRRKDGSIYPEEQTITPVQDTHGEIAHLVAVKQDISVRKRTEERIQIQLKQLNALREIDLAITASLDPRVTFNVLLAHVTGQLDADAADILLFDVHTQTFEFSVGKGFRTSALKHTRLQMGEGLAGAAAKRRSLVAVPDLTEANDPFERSPRFAEEGFVTYHAMPLLAKGSIQGVLEVFHRKKYVPDRDWLDFLEALAGQAAIAIDNAMLITKLDGSNRDLRKAYDSTLEGLARALELRDGETEGHSQRVTEMAIRLGKEMHLSDQDLTHLRRGALLHDIGKMGVPDRILHKPGALNEDEWIIMRRHPGYALEMLGAIDHLRPALDVPYSHHEKWDGSGYPQGLRGNEIPFSARIFAVVDVWDALRSNRAYRAAWSDEDALGYIIDESGQHFDPRVVEAFLGLLEQNGAIKRFKTGFRIPGKPTGAPATTPTP